MSETLIPAQGPVDVNVGRQTGEAANLELTNDLTHNARMVE